MRGTTRARGPRRRARSRAADSRAAIVVATTSAASARWGRATAGSRAAKRPRLVERIANELETSEGVVERSPVARASILHYVGVECIARERLGGSSSTALPSWDPAALRGALDPAISTTCPERPARIGSESTAAWGGSSMRWAPYGSVRAHGGNYRPNPIKTAFGLGARPAAVSRLPPRDHPCGAPNSLRDSRLSPRRHE
jgi:hypothetical protein